ncbi:hypothetical protein BGX27_002446 [Mortierella sp. AM989]|nr:hypothetical protein BGX27_002446 [Mortierella sp. AM989]
MSTPSNDSTTNGSYAETSEIPAENSPPPESDRNNGYSDENGSGDDENQDSDIGSYDFIEELNSRSNREGTAAVEAYTDDEDDNDMSEASQSDSSSGAHDQGQEVIMQDDEEFVMELDPTTGQQRATAVPSNTGRARSSLATHRLRRQHRRMTASVRFATTARPTSARPSSLGSSRSTVGSSASTSTRATLAAPVADQNAQSELRKKIIEIQQDPAIEFSQKASMIQRLMSSNWQGNRKTPEQQAGNDSSVVTEEDLKTTYHDQEIRALGCKHYRRGCKLKANCCGKWFNCRFCHDNVCDHTIVRNETKMMLCMHCKAIQPAAQNCNSCQTRLAHYYCDICKLWDDDSQKPIYHCIDCGICRIGNGLSQDFFHCKKCNVCMHITLRNNHKCIERNLECDCPICGEYMFTSTTTVIFMPCGHSIHAKCHHEYVRTSYQCPTCWKALGDMSPYYQKIDSILAEQTMPSEYANVFSTVLCNDCEVKSEAPYHFLYHKCDKCKGYNTKVLKTFRRETRDQNQPAENVIAAGATGTVPEDNTSGASSTATGPSLSAASGNSVTTVTTTIVDLPEIPRTPLLDGNAAGDSGYDNMAGS